MKTLEPISIVSIHPPEPPKYKIIIRTYVERRKLRKEVSVGRKQQRRLSNKLTNTEKFYGKFNKTAGTHCAKEVRRKGQIQRGFDIAEKWTNE